MNMELRQCRHVLAIDRSPQLRPGRGSARTDPARADPQPAGARGVLGARLFDRDRTRVEPTPVGERLIERARLLVNQARDIEQDLKQMLGLEVGLLRIGAGPYPADLSVGTAIGRLGEDAIPSADGGPLGRRLVRADPTGRIGEIELAVADVGLAGQDDRLVVESLGQHQADFFCGRGHPLAEHADADHRRGSQVPAGRHVVARRLEVLAAKERQGTPLDLPTEVTAPEIRVDTFALVRPVVLESDAIGGAAPSQIRGELERGEVVMLPLELPWLKSSYGIIRLANRTPSPAADAFMDLLREVEAEID